MDLTKLASVVAAADHRSISAAARRLGARISTVSRHVSDLEAEVGTQLFVRTGRGLRPTPGGERFVERARSVLRELGDAVAEARGDARAELDHLRLSAPLELAISLLPSCLARLRAAHPEVRVDVRSEARRVSLFEEDYDAAIRLGRLRDSSLIARPLGSVRLLLCAAPALAATPITERKIAALPFVSVAGTSAVHAKRGRRRLVIEPEPRVLVTTFTEAAVLACEAGMAALLPAYTAHRFLANARLVRLGPDLDLGAVDIHLVLSAHHRGSRILRALGDAVSERLAALEAGLRKR